MKKSLRIICLILAVMMFTLFALGSGSEKASENKGEDAAASGINETAENNDDNGAASGTNNVTTTQAATSSKAEYKQGNARISLTTDSIGSKYITVWWPVTNTGKVNIYLNSGSADIENASGSLEDTISSVNACPEVLKPGETGYYYERTLYDGTNTSGLKAVPHADVEKASVDCIRYKVSDISIKDEQYWGVKVLGRVENTTDEDETLVKVVALLFDANGDIIDKTSDYVDGTLAAGDKKTFECTSLNTGVNASDISKYLVYSYPSQWNF